MTGYFRCREPQGNAFMFSKEAWDDLSRECKTTSCPGFGSMSGFHSGHDPLAQEDEKQRERKKNMSKERI